MEVKLASKEQTHLAIVAFKQSKLSQEDPKSLRIPKPTSLTYNCLTTGPLKVADLAQGLGLKRCSCNS